MASSHSRSNKSIESLLPFSPKDEKLCLLQLSAVFTKAIQSSTSSVMEKESGGFQSLPKGCVKTVEGMLADRMTKCTQVLKSKFEKRCIQKRACRFIVKDEVPL